VKPADTIVDTIISTSEMLKSAPSSSWTSIAVLFLFGRCSVVLLDGAQL
jgi:hypothetical protein